MCAWWQTWQERAAAKTDHIALLERKVQRLEDEAGRWKVGHASVARLRQWHACVVCSRAPPCTLYVASPHAHACCAVLQDVSDKADVSAIMAHNKAQELSEARAAEKAAAAAAQAEVETRAAAQVAAMQSRLHAGQETQAKAEARASELEQAAAAAEKREAQLVAEIGDLNDLVRSLQSQVTRLRKSADDGDARADTMAKARDDATQQLGACPTVHTHTHTQPRHHAPLTLACALHTSRMHPRRAPQRRFKTSMPS